VDPGPLLLQFSDYSVEVHISRVQFKNNPI
jgi:hypothetical protein